MAETVTTTKIKRRIKTIEKLKMKMKKKKTTAMFFSPVIAG